MNPLQLKFASAPPVGKGNIFAMVARQNISMVRVYPARANTQLRRVLMKNAHMQDDFVNCRFALSHGTKPIRLGDLLAFPVGCL